MGNLLVSRFLIPLVTVICICLYILRPGGVDGPTPPPVPQPGKGFDHSLWTDILAKIRRPDATVDFGAVRAAQSDLDQYLGALRASSPLSAPHRFRDRSNRMAYYLNAYNATLVNLLAANCPMRSPNDLYWADGLFWRVSVLIGEKRVTLTQLETNRIEPLVLADPRARFAVFRGNRSTPLLQQEAFDGQRLDEQLNKIVRLASKDERFVQNEGKTVSLHPLFFWNKLEFGDYQTWLHRYGVEVDSRANFVEITYDDRVNEWQDTCSGYKP